MSNEGDSSPRGFRGLIAWQKAMDFADRVLTVCDAVQRGAGAGIVPQLRRAVISVPSNIAEGYGEPDPENVRYLRMAKCSLQESETDLELLRRRRAVKNETAIELFAAADELARVIRGLMKSKGG